MKEGSIALGQLLCALGPWHTAVLCKDRMSRAVDWDVRADSGQLAGIYSLVLSEVSRTLHQPTLFGNTQLIVCGPWSQQPINNLASHISVYGYSMWYSWFINTKLTDPAASCILSKSLSVIHTFFKRHITAFLCQRTWSQCFNTMPRTILNSDLPRKNTKYKRPSAKKTMERLLIYSVKVNTGRLSITLPDLSCEQYKSCSSDFSLLLICVWVRRMKWALDWGFQINFTIWTNLWIQNL